MTCHRLQGYEPFVDLGGVIFVESRGVYGPCSDFIDPGDVALVKARDKLG